MSDRAVLFIDGNNWYHSLKDTGVASQGNLNYAGISQKLVQHREWTGTRYYIGQVQQTGSPALYAAQRSFLQGILAQDRRISAHFGRLEPRPFKNPAAEELLSYLIKLPIRIDTGVYKDLIELANRHRRGTVQVEKAVDVMIAVDMISMAEHDEYDTAYLLSADGDFTPAVKEARNLGRSVFAASPSFSSKLSQECNTYIHLDRGWFSDCY
jgi:uncharacterized LabA/DUF88 family protein